MALQVKTFFGEKKIMRRNKLQSAVVPLICFIGAVSFWIAFFSPPGSFPVGSTLKIPPGMTLRETAYALREKGFIRSRLFFEAVSRISGGGVVAGQYSFNARENALLISLRMNTGDFRTNFIKVTVPEGLTVRDIGKILEANLSGFEQEKFFILASTSEGYLFPNTYFFPPIAAPEEVIFEMRHTFEVQTKDLAPLVKASEHSWHEIVTMASLLEEEAATPEARRMVSGILWRRIEKNIPLQVDAAFIAVNGKTTFELSLKDLAINSPYNTYRRRGLPPAPIVSPGLDAIRAALEPTESPYLYYLSDKEGEMHYSVDFEGHKKNKEKYLN